MIIRRQAAAFFDLAHTLLSRSDETVDECGRRFQRIGASDDGDFCAVGQRELEPSRTPRITGGGLSTVGFEWMRNSGTPFGFVMIFTSTGEYRHLAIGGRREAESWAVNKRCGILHEVLIGAVAARGFRMKGTILHIETYG